jgi:hypothetical protein
MSTVDIDSLLDKYAQNYHQLLRFASIEAKEISERKRSETQTAIRTHLKAELLAKMPKKQYTSVGLVTDPHDLSKGPTGKIPIQNGYNQAITEITKLVENL